MRILLLVLALGGAFWASYSDHAAPFIDDQPAFRTTRDGMLLTVLPPPEEP